MEVAGVAHHRKDRRLYSRLRESLTGLVWTEKFFFCFSLAVPCGMHNFLYSGGTHAPCSGSAESWALTTKEVPDKGFLKINLFYGCADLRCCAGLSLAAASRPLQVQASASLVVQHRSKALASAVAKRAQWLQPWL